ncbi:MAG: HD-GYP domain-containing protein [Candidatus Marinimicrobia bacterium]|nr:HD-GYP domain-containing protein [Candidatus Neomarinimicrobiota bacterium]
MRPIDRPTKIKIEDLRIGMFVELPGNWLNHSFVRSSFLVKHQSQLTKIAQSGIETVVVHPVKSLVRPEPKKKQPNYIKKSPVEIEATREEGPSLIPEGYSDFLQDSTIEPKRKASYLHEVSLDIMDKVLKAPSVENITHFKAGISEMVDLIMADDETASHLLKITSHDHYTFTHSVNVGVLSVLLTKAIYGNSSHHDLQELGAAFFLHDLGKVYVPDSLINKPGKLNEEEWKLMQNHPLGGYQILSDTDHLSPECKIIVMQHHERDNGTGYPQGLRGDEIHVYGRICAIADVFDALTSRRSYKPSMPLYDALMLMKYEMGSHFNADLFAEFVQLFKK